MSESQDMFGMQQGNTYHIYDTDAPKCVHVVLFQNKAECIRQKEQCQHEYDDAKECI